MTATMDFNTELITIQNELKKTIYHHQLTQMKNNEKSNDNLKKDLKNLQSRILQLSKRQKIILNNLRKERLNASSLDQMLYYKPLKNINQSFLMQNSNMVKKSPFSNQDPKQRLSLRAFINPTKLLIPVSAAAATSKKTNQQILVVPTPGGGARLVTTRTNSARTSLNKPFNVDKSLININGINKNNSNNSLLQQSQNPKNSQNILTNGNNGTNSNNSKNQNSNSKFSSDKNNAVDKEIVKPNEPIDKKKSTSPVQPVEKEPVVIKEIKETKIDEVKEKEGFFAALGLVTKKALSEIQNKKCERKRRTTANPQFSNAAIEAKRISALELAAKKAKKRELMAASSNQPETRLNNNSNKRVFLNSNRGKVVNNNRNTADKKTVPKVSTDKTINQNNINKKIKISQNCFVCDEVCDSDLDAIMFCEDCQCLFHVTCSSTIDSIKKTMGVPCPKCERKRSLEDEISSNFADGQREEENFVKEKTDNVAVNTSNNRRKINRKNLQNSTNHKRSESSKSNTNNKNTENNKESKYNEEKEKLLVKHFKIIKQIKDYKKKLSFLNDKVYISKENRREMLLKKESSKRSIETIINFVKKIKEDGLLKEKQIKKIDDIENIEINEEVKLKEIDLKADNLNDEIKSNDENTDNNDNIEVKDNKTSEKKDSENEIQLPPLKKLKLANQDLKGFPISQDETSAAIASIQETS